MLLTYKCHPKGLLIYILFETLIPLSRERHEQQNIHIDDVALDNRITSLIGSYLRAKIQNNQSKIQPTREAKEREPGIEVSRDL